MPSSIELDAGQLARLRALDRDGRLLGRLATAFEHLLEGQQPRLAAARAEPPDRAALREAMHMLKSATRELGALHLAARCEHLEQQDEGLDLHAELASFDTELAALRAALKRMTP